MAVLRGGPSEEYEVSLKTGEAVLSALAKKKVPAADFIISRQGRWLKDGLEKTPEQALAGVDVAFIALHGAYGEDGTVQRLLDRFGIAYTGSRAYPSALAMNKLLTKQELKNSGLKTPAHFKVTRESGDLTRVVNTIESLFGPDYVIKPLNSGSSIGVQMAKGSIELLQALQSALIDRDNLLVEERVVGREATVGVLERFRDQGYYQLPVIEIVPPVNTDFFDYESKYNGKTDEICPGRFTDSEKIELAKQAVLAHQALNLSQLSRSDFMLSDNGIYYLETNTLPGLTPESLYPKALAAVGCSYEDFVLHLVEDAIRQPV